MHRRIAVVIVLSAVVIAAEVGARVLADGLPPPARWSTPELNYKVGQIDGLADRGVDILIAGTSVTDAGVNPRLLDELLGPTATSYNGSVGAGTIRMVEVWTSAAAERLDPSTVVIGLVSRELNPNDPDQVDAERRFLESPAVQDRLDSGNVVDRLEREISEWSYLMRYRRELRVPENLLGGGTLPWGEALTGPRGQYLRFLDGEYEHTVRQRRFLRRTALNDFAIGQEEVAALRRLVRSLIEAERRVVVVMMPTTTDWISLHPEGARDHVAAVDTVRAVAREAGAEFHALGPWPDGLFADAVHLNDGGARRFTTRLADLLRTGSR